MRDFQGLNSVFSLRLEDISGAFSVEPTEATGTTSVNIRVTNGSLDYENPNQRKFIVLVSTYLFCCIVTFLLISRYRYFSQFPGQ